MIVIPAIDLKNGACVRLEQGDFTKETVYSSNPLSVAEKWIKDGAERLHLVDLDGAKAGFPVQKELVIKIAQNIKIPVEIGGGIRDEETISFYLDHGVEWVILGSMAVSNPRMVAAVCRKYPGRIILGVDAREGLVATDGWLKTTSIAAVELVQQAVDWGIREVIYTDIARDGMLSGPNISALEKITTVSGIKVIASGGISSLADLMLLKTLEPRGLMGAIIGKALYSGKLDLKKAISLLEGRNGN